jgi:hypothetical protein
MFREAIEYPGFSFVHVLAGCVTYQTPTYAEQIYQRCVLLPERHDPTDFALALDVARGQRFALGVLYRRDPNIAPGIGESSGAHEAGVWPPVTQALGQEPMSDVEFPGG